MSRMTRFILSGVPQHVIQYSNNQEPCFYSKDTYNSTGMILHMPDTFILSILRQLLYGLLFCLLTTFPIISWAETKEDKINSDEIKQLVETVKTSTRNFQLEIKRSPDKPLTILKPNNTSELFLDLTAQGVTSSMDVYAMVLLVEGDRMVVERVSKEMMKSKSKIRSLSIKFGTLNYQGLGSLSNKAGKKIMKVGYADIKRMKIDLAGNVGTNPISTMKISPDNYPVHLSLPFETFSQLLLSFTKQKMSKKAMDKFRMDNEKFPVTVNLVYLATLKGNGKETIKNISLKIMPPKSVFFYDGIVLAPALVKRFANGINVVRYDDDHVNRLIIPSASPSNTTRPKVTKVNTPKSKPLEVNGKLSISVPSATKVNIGRASTVKFTVKYEDLNPSSEIYVLLQPVNGNELIQLNKGTRIKSKYTSAKMRLCNDPQLAIGHMRIKEKPIIINAPVFLGRLEAGRIGESKKGGQGVVSNTVTFTPPPFNVYYDRIRATPISLSWSNDGRLCTVMDTGKFSYIDIKISGR